MKIFLTIFLFFFAGHLYSQNGGEYNIWNPATGVYALEGRTFSGKVKDFYDRLPAGLENNVRKEVWNLSKNAAGLSLRFKSNAKEIIVRYQVGGVLQMSHMPATGVSGVDLFAKETGHTDWLWTNGNYKFRDTIVYTFTNLERKNKAVMREYTLFLPLYNSVKWLEILTPKESIVTPLAPRKEKPIIIYGTSIAQGGCASRPGMAWTNILQRNLNNPVINWAFSGNGRLEQPILDVMAETDALIYVLDCLPNLAKEGLAPRIVNAVTTLRKKKPNTPILLTEHCGNMNEGIDEKRRDTYQALNRIQKNVYDSLIKSGMKNLYYLFKKEIGLDINSTVDYVHPNDVGMLKYADAYTKKLNKILGRK